MSEYTISPDFTKALTANSSAASFASKIPTATEPTGSGVLSTGPGGADTVKKAHNNLLLLFYGTGADDTTFNVRIIGWRKISTLWVPVVLAQISCTLSAVVGVAGQSVVATERFVDTLTLAAGFNANVSVELISPANDTVGHILLDAKGFQKIELSFDMTGATDANGLYAAL